MTIDPKKRLDYAATVKALADAIRQISIELAPKAKVVNAAIREQIYHGYEVPMGKDRGADLVWYVYEKDRPWSSAAVARVMAGAEKGKGELNRDHVNKAETIVKALMDSERTVDETADFLDEMLVTCTVTADEHAALGRVGPEFVGWDRYTEAKIEVQDRFDLASVVVT